MHTRRVSVSASGNDCGETRRRSGRNAASGLVLTRAVTPGGIAPDGPLCSAVTAAAPAAVALLSSAATAGAAGTLLALATEGDVDSSGVREKATRIGGEGR